MKNTQRFKARVEIHSLATRAALTRASRSWMVLLHRGGPRRRVYSLRPAC
jgi:hypothetical protein